MIPRPIAVFCELSKNGNGKMVVGKTRADSAFQLLLRSHLLTPTTRSAFENINDCAAGASQGERGIEY